MKKIYILHEYGDPKHFTSLQYYADNTGIDLNYKEFTPFKQICKGILRGNTSLIGKGTSNLLFIINAIFSKNKVIVLGAAPYDFHILLFLILKRNHKVIYFSSWPYWHKEKYPKKIRFPYQHLLWESFLRNIQAVMVSNVGAKNMLKYTENIVQIPHSIDDKIFRNKNKNKNNKIKLNLLYVGRLTESKGIPVILELLDDPEIKEIFNMNIVGWGDLDNQISEYARTRKNINYYGRISSEEKLVEIYNENDIFLLPSQKTSDWEELFGIVLIEAMMCGLISIASAHVGPKEIISNGLNGYLLENASKDNIKSILLRLYKDQNKINQIRKRAILDASENYSIAINAKKWGQLLEGIL